MHLLPLLLIPVVIYIMMTANNPPTDPRVRVQQAASQELFRIREELKDARDLKLTNQRLSYTKAGQTKTLDASDITKFELDGDVLIIKVTAKEGDAEKTVMARIPTTS